MQIYGTKKCRATRKAERFFRDRGIAYHFADLAGRGISKGELENIRRGCGGKSLVDMNGPVSTKSGMAYMVFDEIEEILENPLLMRTPVVREGRAVVVGDDEEGWKSLAAAMK